MRWSVPEHDAARAQLAAILDDPNRTGAVVVGADGIGKSTLVRAVAAEYSQRQPDARVRWVTGTPTERMVPFGAVSHLVAVAELGKPAALLRSARESLGANVTDLLVIDDANQLDALSATWVYQLALAGQTKMLVTASRGVAPAAVSALWTDAVLEVVPIEGGAEDTAGRVDEYFAQLPSAGRAVLELLAVQEPLPWDDVTAVVGTDAVDEAQRLGAVEVESRSDGVAMVFTAHPDFGDRARKAVAAGDEAKVRASLVPLMTARVRDHPSDRLRLALLAMDSATPQPVDTVTAAAEEALRLGDVTLAERLARSAVERSSATPARLTLAQALAWQGRGRDADTVLGAVPTDTLSDAELMAIALPRAANQFWMLNEPERATAYLQNARNRVTDPAAALTIDALTATFAMNAGAPRRALQIARTVLDTPAADDTAVAWAASAACLCSARAGQLSAVDGYARQAFAAEHPGLLRFTVGLAQTTALVLTGRLDEAEQTARRYLDFSELQQPGRAIGEVLVAQVLMARGDDAAAIDLLAPAATTLDRSGYSWGPLSLTLWATALARDGELAEAAKVLRRAESRHGTKSALFAPELGVARAWQLAAARDHTGGINAARQAARMAERAEQSAVAVLAWHDAVRLGDIHAGGPLERLASEINCVSASLALAHARALASRDRAALTAAAEQLAAAGMLGAAADASRQAAAG